MPSVEDIVNSGLWIYGRWIIGPRWERLGSSVIIENKLYYVSSYYLDFRKWASENIHVSTDVTSRFYRPFVFEAFTNQGLVMGKVMIRQGLIPVNKSLRNEYRMVWYTVLLDWGLPIEIAVKIIESVLNNGCRYYSSPRTRRPLDA